MSKLNKYLLHIQEGCGGGCGGGGTGNCGFPPIGRGGTGVCTSYTDFPDVQDTNNYQTQFYSDILSNKIGECEENPLDISDPENSVSTPMSPIELPEGGEAGEKKKIVEEYIKNLNEQNKKEEDEEIEEPPVEEPPVEEPPVETPIEPTSTAQGGEAAGDMGATPGMETPGMPGEEDQVPKDPEYIGRVYELKKIYSRLVSIESFLNDASDVRLLKLRNYISSSIELFQTLINNVDAYKDNMDELIVLFYKFLLIVYTLLKKYYEKENKKIKKNK